MSAKVEGTATMPAMSTQLENSIIGTFDTHLQAERSVQELERSGFDMRRLSIVGKGYQSEEHPVGFYTMGDRMKTWGGLGAFWGGLWGVLLGAAFFWVPGLGPLAVAGPLVGLLVSGLEGAAVVGGLGVLGAALASLGVPKKSILKYETQIKANKYLVIAHGNTQEIEQARSIMERSRATETEMVSA